ncbi:hypothetical protein PHMEG_0005449 [Phytophthora megakarya]|uniref:RxLR effector protein n=1 Tax=Phytophthora megakarya TaxID=4795 RepID=A0A225WRB8_9STRA|nr:hypothetical protein PHMEG_0005449 [Phytophthora megakarya]
MRASYIITVLIFVFTGDASSTAIPSETKIAKMTSVQGSSKRFLRSYDLNDLSRDNEERTIIEPAEVDEILGINEANRLMHPDRIDEIFGGLEDGKILGKIDRTTIDSLYDSPRADYKQVFAQWMGDGVSPTELTNFIKSHAALKQKYTWVATMYEGFRCVDEIFARLNGKILGKIDKNTIDGLRGSSSNHRKKGFAQWKEDGVSPNALTNFIESNPALKNAYSWAATMYNGFMNRAQ